MTSPANLNQPVPFILFGLFVAGCASVPVVTPATLGPWVQTSAPAFKGKQDDLHFVDSEHGVYVNGAGQVFRTSTGGAQWEKVLEQAGTFWRTVGFVDEQNGFLGNIGTDYFPGVTDATPLYRTRDGGRTVTPVDTGGPAVKGLCAIDVAKVKVINSGVLEERTLVHAAGRVGGPAWLIRSLDGGQNWQTIDLNHDLAMITDVKFFSPSVGFVVGGSNADVEQSHAVILKTVDGGAHWQRVYESTRPFELVWKVVFPTAEVGFATVMHYDEKRVEQVVAKTVDGGEHWVEVPLVRDAAAREFGVGFATAQTGWVGTAVGGFQTTDGGLTWAPVKFGTHVNKVRIVRGEGAGFVAYAIGKEVYKLDAR